MGVISGTILWGNKASDDVDVVVEKSPYFPMPARKREVISIPGRNGDIIITQDAYENVVQEYELAIVTEKDLPTAVRAVMEWLMRPAGYARLEDSFNPDIYRLAYLNNTNNIENNFQVAGRAKVTWSCKPERFLRSGERPILCFSGIKLANPTVYTAKPLIVVKGTGAAVLTIGDSTVSISEIGTEIDIDCENQSAYYGSTNKNNKITVTGGFPKLNAGDTQISWTGGGVTSVEITPRWWIL